MRACWSSSRAAARMVAGLLAVVLSLGAAGWGHSAANDPDSDPIPVLHNHNAHRFRSGALPSGPADQHCLLCHSLRSLGSALLAAHEFVAADARVRLLRPVDVATASRLLDPATASRAPPVLL